jgi:hypothetical protein
MLIKTLFTALFPLLYIFYAGPLFAAQILSFTVSPTNVSFADQDPDLGEIVSSPELSVDFRIRQLNTNEIWTLEIRADNDLVSGRDSIPAENIRWTVTGSGNPRPTFYNGTLERGIYLLAGEGPGRGNRTINIRSSFFFYLTNSWSYPSGDYSGTVTFRLTVPGASAQTRTVDLSISLGSRAKLDFGGISLIIFPNANPDSVPSIPADVNPMNLVSSMRTGRRSRCTLTCITTGDLVSGTNTIPVRNITWTATGDGYQSGTMSRTREQRAGSWRGSGTRAGTFSYFFENSWTYLTGTYTTTIDYTLTAP